MTTATQALIEYRRKLELELGEDWLRQMVRQFAWAMIELEAEQKIGAGPHEHSPNRLTQQTVTASEGWQRGCANWSCASPKYTRRDTNGAGSDFAIASRTKPVNAPACETRGSGLRPTGPTTGPELARQSTPTSHRTPAAGR